MAKIKINSTEFYYELHGKGHPLVLIAGYTCDHQFWIPILEDMAKHFQVLIFDNHGVGQTKDSNAHLNVELMAKDIVDLYSTLGLDKPHVIGQSMGGTIAQTIAAQYPDKVNKLGILTSSPKWRKAMLNGLESLLNMRKNNVDFDIIFLATIAWVFGEKFLKNTEMVNEFKKIILSMPNPQSLEDQIRQFDVLANFDGIKNLSYIKAPTLVAYGNEDIISLPGEAKLMSEKITNAKLMEFNCAHGITSEVPQELSKAIIEFF